MYIGAIPTPAATESRQEFTAVANQTVFNTTGGTVGYCDCYLNGVKMANSDFSFDGADVTLTTGAAAGDVLAVVMRQADNALVALPITDSAGNNVLSESGGVVTLTSDEANVGSNALVVDSSGNVGIGTSSPSEELEIRKDNATIYINGGASAYELTSTLKFTRAKIETAIQSGTANGDTRMEFHTRASGIEAERMRIDSSGNVMIGTETVSFENSNSISFYTQFGQMFLNHSSTSNGTYYAAFAYNGSVIGSITQSTTSSVAYNTSSDYRLKENITEITDGITRVKQLNPSRFNFIADPENTVDGFIAHEVQDIIPEAITGEKDAVNEDGSIRPQGIDQSKLVPLLTAALQEAIALIESQQSQIDALTTRIEALETPA